MTAFIIRVNHTIRNNFERAVQAGVWDTQRMRRNPRMQAGDVLYFWITGDDGAGLAGRAIAAGDLRPLADGDVRPWVSEDTTEYRYRVELSDVQRVMDPGVRYSDIPDAPSGPMGVIPLSADGERFIERQLRGFTVVEPSATTPQVPAAPDDAPLSELEKEYRRYVERTIAVRQGQGTFRADLISVYGGRCPISGCSVLAVLDAAHIVPHRGTIANRTTNGMLLRTDLHTLFDLHQLAIVDDVVQLAPNLRDDPQYGGFHGKKVTFPDGGHAPKGEYLDAHRGKCDWLDTV